MRKYYCIYTIILLLLCHHKTAAWDRVVECWEWGPAALDLDNLELFSLDSSSNPISSDSDNAPALSTFTFDFSLKESCEELDHETEAYATCMSILQVSIALSHWDFLFSSNFHEAAEPYTRTRLD